MEVKVEVEVGVGDETGDDDDDDDVVVEDAGNAGAMPLSPIIRFKSDEFVVGKVRRDAVVGDDDEEGEESDVLLPFAVTAALEAWLFNRTDV